MLFHVSEIPKQRDSYPHSRAWVFEPLNGTALRPRAAVAWNNNGDMFMMAADSATWADVVNFLDSSNPNGLQAYVVLSKSQYGTVAPIKGGAMLDGGGVVSIGCCWWHPGTAPFEKHQDPRLIPCFMNMKAIDKG